MDTTTTTTTVSSSSGSSKMEMGNTTTTDSSSSSSSSSTTSKMKALVEEVCALEAFREKRAAKMDLDDFLALLAEFNKRGVHFAS
jgi:18S rRNA (adenine1779-N6/adenine1780-N6)-dimethyltransferase